jgi:hypothetical protein
LGWLLVAPLVALTALSGADCAHAQAVSFKNFNTFHNVVPGVDFFASSRQVIAPYEKAAAEAVAKLKGLFDEDLPKGAIFICSNLAQKDSLYEPVVLKRGYSWVLISVTPEVRMQETMARIRSRIGDNMPEEMRRRMSNPPRDMASGAEQQAAGEMARDIAFAVLQSMLGGADFRYRSSRVTDVVKSPLPDWLDVGIAAYASGDTEAIRYLRANLDQAFSIEDVIGMSRPFVSTSSDQQGGSGGSDGGGAGEMGGGFPGGGMGQMGGGFPGGGMGGGMPGGGFPGGGAGGQGTRTKPKAGGEGMPPRVLSKAEQDRLLFDGQAITFFEFFLQKFGAGGMKQLIQYVRQGKETREYLVQPDVLGDNFAQIESDWSAWLNEQPMPADPRPKPKFNNAGNSNNRNRG